MLVCWVKDEDVINPVTEEKKWSSTSTPPSLTWVYKTLSGYWAMIWKVLYFTFHYILSEKLISIYGSLIWNNGNPLKVDNWTNLKSCRLSFLWDITKHKQAFYPWLWLFYSGDCLFKATDLGSIYRGTQDAIPFPHR